ncbi:SNF2 family N-terminal domain-containing protein [Gloeopeniophorella convolvens]|nr:SNF2 family N-terminal domain-containing protein [Gloeopeniophorella convolvens]
MMQALLEKSSIYTGALREYMERSRARHAVATHKPKSKPAAKPAPKPAMRGRRGGRKRVRDEDEGDGDAQKRAKVDDADEGTTPFVQPALLTGGVLKDYQLEGVAWMVSLWENGISGILADEMGLGKTIQTIAFIAYLRVRVEAPFLVVCPLSVLHNWMDEFARFAPDIAVCMYHGSPAERAELRRTVMRHPDDAPKPAPKRNTRGKRRAPSPTPSDSDSDIQIIEPEPAPEPADDPANPTRQKSTFPVVLTTYEMVVKDRAHLARYKWGQVIVDEGHRLKNANAVLVREIKRYPSAGRMLLTGTPLHNNLAELWALLNFILPDVFDDVAAFQDTFNIPTASTAPDARTHALVAQLHAILRPFLLRRTKADAARALPPKKEYVLYAPLMPPQRVAYDAVLRGGLRALLAGSTDAARDAREREEAVRREIEEDEQAGRTGVRTRRVRAALAPQVKSAAAALGAEHARKAKLKQVNNMRLQNTVMQLRKVCSHPFLFDAGPEAESSTDDVVRASGKMMLLERLLDALFARGHSVLLFSQFTSMLDILEDWATHTKHYALCRIDGSTPPLARRAEMARFQAGGARAPRLFLLSTRAGGLGINLTAADTVVFYDQDWNPQMDLQAQDRAHRIGQTRPVLVFRLVTRHTVESTIMQRAAAKRALEALVIAKGRFKAPISAAPDARHQTVAEMAAALLALADERTEVAADADPADVLPDAELGVLLDRRAEVFAARGAGWAAGAGGRFAVYEAPRDVGNDALARMMGEEEGEGV